MQGFCPQNRRWKQFFPLRNIWNISQVVSVSNFHADNMLSNSSFKVNYKWEENMAISKHKRMKEFVVKALVVRLCWICTSLGLLSFPIPICFSGKNIGSFFCLGEWMSVYFWFWDSDHPASASQVLELQSIPPYLAI